MTPGPRTLSGRMIEAASGLALVPAGTVGGISRGIYELRRGGSGFRGGFRRVWDPSLACVERAARWGDVHNKKILDTALRAGISILIGSAVGPTLS